MENKYQLTAKEIQKAVGSEQNYSKVFNCMTRLRFTIIDKTQVDELAIKKIPLVKGINWSGEQLQIIIGGEVVKVKDAFDQMSQPNNVSKKSAAFVLAAKPKKKFKDLLLSALSQIMVPVLPVLMAAGMLLSLKAILVQSGAMQNVGEDVSLQDANIMSAVFYLIAEIGIKFLAVFIGITTMRYLGGNIIMQAFVSIALANPLAFDLANNSFMSWELFKIGDFPIKVSMFPNSILPQIGSAFVLFYLDKWVKKWMPSVVDVMFRPMLTFAVTVFAMLFLFGPILSLVETGLSIVINWIGKAPYGIGLGIFTLLWQPLVITGVHMAVIMQIINQLANAPQPLLSAPDIAAFGQVGALIAIMIRTKNEQTRITAMGFLPAGILGITEPIIYGLTLPKWKPFLAGILGAFVGGLFAGLVGVEARTVGGLGILAVTGMVGSPSINSTAGIFGVLSMEWNIALYLVSFVVAIATGLGFGLLLYVERKNEVKEVKKYNKKLIQIYAKTNHLPSKQAAEALNSELEQYGDIFKKDDLERLIQIEKQLIKQVKLEVILKKKMKLQETNLQKLTKKIDQELLKKQPNQELIEKWKSNLTIWENNSTINQLVDQVETIKIGLDADLKWLSAWQDMMMQLIKQTLINVASETKNQEILNLENNYFNALHSLDINYELTASKAIIFNKKQLKKEMRS